MRVAIDATAIGSGLGGDETLVASFVRGLAALGREDDTIEAIDVLAAGNATLPSELGVAAADVQVDRCRRRGGPAHFGIALPRWLAGLRPPPDVVLTNTHAPVRAPAPVALTVPDLSFHHHPDHYPAHTRLRLRALVGHQARRSPIVLTISEFCRDDLVTTYGLDPARVHTIPLTIDTPVEPDAARRSAVLQALARAGVGERYLLFLGNLHPRKNVARTIRAFVAARQTDGALAHHQLVVAGARWWRGSDEEQAAAGAPPGSVVLLGRVDEATREVLLRDATALVYVSHFEGFGLPPVEAMARGTAVVASDRAAVPEVCGDAALLVDPTDTDAIADALHTVVCNEAVRRHLELRGRERSRRFTVDATAAALERALASVPPAP